MTPSETVMLTRYVAAVCPHQRIDEYTPDAWYDVLGDLNLDDCRAAVAVIKRRSVFVDPSEIHAEVRRIRNDRLAREPVPAPPAELADQPGRYRAAVQGGVKRIADGMTRHLAIAPVREDAPPKEFTEAREKLGPAIPRSKQEIARQQAEQSRAERAARDAIEPPGETA